MTDLNLFGEPEPGDMPKATPKLPVKPLASWQYSTLAQAAVLLKMTEPEAMKLLDNRAGQLLFPTLTPENGPIYSRKSVNKMLNLVAARRGERG